MAELEARVDALERQIASLRSVGDFLDDLTRIRQGINRIEHRSRRKDGYL